MKSLPFSLGYAAECNRCTKIIKKFIKPGRTNNTNKLNPDRYIPEKIFLGAKGFAIFTIAKAGFLWAGCLGTGLVVAKLPDGSWSAPSAIALGGASFGAQIGGEIISLVIVLNTVEALRAFSLGGNFTLGGQLSGT
ncbi:hypothetical protein HMI54_004258 [Coelomomyces lativittatus]|nr:hypothetical protein HMI55_002124 [Coelomomyces lativittatus]KAJ1507363.1 hypothetical protein HMI54_004258 [Coelomomyces lativittatus]KAJ1513674.1 hypothetical protein HMI56_001991 [Coelomomyces lativittatus]